VFDTLRQLREVEDDMKEREMSETMKRLARVDALDAEVTALGEQYTAKRAELAEAERELLADARISAIVSQHATVKKAKPARAELLYLMAKKVIKL
jgi:glycerol-3-phosphate O-acyltransferase